MIPFVYSLRKDVRFERMEDSFLVASEIPFNVLRVSTKAGEVLRLCDGKRTLDKIALESGVADEGEAYRICDVFNKRGILEIDTIPLNGYHPFVTVIIPTRDRGKDIRECLESVFFQDYPDDRIEVIVVDDGSKDGTLSLLSGYPCVVVSQKESHGQSYCRNCGASVAHGEILAFLDSDCVASRSWLRELTAPFQWEEVAAVGGFVDGYFDDLPLDRYERSFSSLNMGKHILVGKDDGSTIYVPTCNLLVRRSAFMEAGGVRESMRVGEDVDLCWRIREKGGRLLYMPCGAVRHKHRSVLRRMLKRRAQYGTSEALLYGLHPDKKKMLPLPTLATLVFLALCAAIFFSSPFPLAAAGVAFLGDWASRMRKVRRVGLPIASRKILFSLVRTYLSLFYFISFHLLRYYALLLLLIGIVFHPFLLLFLWALLFASIVDYLVKQPRLSFLSFLFYYTLEHLAYQVGVFVGCLRHRTFGSYKVVFKRRST
jgi:mycofactocin system glycosyltransferase